MTQNQTDLNTCTICNKTFASERELQDHQRNAHNQSQGEKHPMSERNQTDRPDQDEQKQEKIA